MAFIAPLLLWAKKGDELYTSDLLRGLKVHLTDHGSNINVSTELKKAKQTAMDAKARYLDHFVVKEAWAAVEARKFKVEGSTSEDEGAIFLLKWDGWHKRVHAAECQSMNVPGLKIPQQLPLNRDFVNTIVMSWLDAHLFERCQTISMCSDVQCTVEDLDSAVLSLSRNVESLEQQLESLTFLHARNLIHFEELLKEYIGIKEQWPASDTVSTEWLRIRSLALELQCYKGKMGVIEMELLTDMYSRKNVDALKLRRAQLEDETVQTRKTIEEMEQRLSAFKKIQRRVTDVVEEYGSICEEINRVDRALAAL